MSEEYIDKKVKIMYKMRDEIAKELTKFFDLAEETLLSGEGYESALEYIGIKSDELLQKL